MSEEKKIILVSPHGFCAGVDRAIHMMERALEKYGAPLYCLNEIVHNPIVVNGFADKGVRFVRSLSEVPHGNVVLFSAHGVSPDVRAEAEAQDLRVIDATCPFVDKIHREVRRWSAQGKKIFLVGHRKHEEIKGISGEAPNHVIVVENEQEALAADVDESSGVAVATQTTLSQHDSEAVISVLKEKYRDMERASRGDICYATLNRQKAVRALAGKADLVLVIGSRNSSNTNRLVEVARAEGLHAELVDALDALAEIELSEYRSIGVTAGASTPEEFTETILQRLRENGFQRLEKLEVVQENCKLTIPEI
jgi:4-hydroxy-3-methylbut-2-enyl diphosphate reductase